MLDPSNHQKAIQKLTTEVRAELAKRHSQVFENLRTRHCPDASDEEAQEQILPPMAAYLGCPEATDLNMLVNHDLAQRTWAIELGVKERWDVGEVLVQSDQAEDMEKNLAEGRDSDTDRLELSLASEAVISAKLAAHDQKLAGLAKDLSESALAVGKLLGLPEGTSAKDILIKLDRELDGALLDFWAEALLPKIRQVNGLEHDPPRAEIRAMLLSMLDDL